MKTKKAFYNDNGSLVSGILIERFFHKPVFYALEEECGWSSQVISKRNKEMLITTIENIPSSVKFTNYQYIMLLPYEERVEIFSHFTCDYANCTVCALKGKPSCYANTMKAFLNANYDENDWISEEEINDD